MTLIEEMKRKPITPPSRHVDYLMRKGQYSELISKIPITKPCTLKQDPLMPCGVFNITSADYYYNNEILSDFREAKEYTRPEVFLRWSILESLRKIDEELYSFGLRLFVKSGYRARPLQVAIRAAFLKIRGGRFVERMFADPQYYLPHATGAAFDIELLDRKTNTLLPTKLKDRDRVDRWWLEEKTYLTLDEREVRNNRRLLHNLLTTDRILDSEQIFTAHPWEYWHHSRFERLAAFLNGDGYPVLYEEINQPLSSFQGIGAIAIRG
jgi:D-alanyl-D-alanine dipeptidase